MPVKKKTTTAKSSTKKTVTTKSKKSNDRMEMYIILILWLAIASTFMVLGYLTNSLGFGADAANSRWQKKYQNTRIPTPITTPYIAPSGTEPGVWPTPSVMNPASQQEMMMNQKTMPGMVPNPRIEEGR